MRSWRIGIARWLYGRHPASWLSRVFAAVTFAEAGERDTAIQLMRDADGRDRRTGGK